MKTRIAPKGGYNFEEKTKYRESIWKSFSENLDAHNAVVAFLPSKEGLEIPVALKYGFREENLIAIDRNAALLATANWRKKYPKIRCYGSEVNRAGKRILEDKIKLDAINLDLCSNLSMPLTTQVFEFIENIGIPERSSGDDFIFALTVLRGRESQAISFFRQTFKNDKIEELAKGTGYRIAATLHNTIEESKVHVKPVLKGSYLSGKQSMGFAIMRLKSSKQAYTEYVNSGVETSYKKCIKDLRTLYDQLYSIPCDLDPKLAIIESIYVYLIRLGKSELTRKLSFEFKSIFKSYTPDGWTIPKSGMFYLCRDFMVNHNYMFKCHGFLRDYDYNSAKKYVRLAAKELGITELEYYKKIALP